MRQFDDQVRIEFVMPLARARELDALSAESGVRRSDLIRFAIMRLLQNPDALIGGPTAAALDALAALAPASPNNGGV